MKPVVKEDRAVSEIIGAILLFAIATVLLTSFILWYVPSTGTNNDISYQSSTQKAFSSLDSKILNPSLTAGGSISQSFPLGVSGTPPFTPSQSTNLYYSNNFKANLNYSMDVNYSNVVTKKIVNVAACANASSSNIINNNYVSSQFKFSVNFQETGLPAGYYWTVTLGGAQESASPIGSHYASIISFSLSRGTYSYTISTDNKTDRPSPAVGTVKVSNQGQTVPVEFYNELSGQGLSVVAAAYGSTKVTNSINTANFVGVVTQSNICDITYPNYWLNNTPIHSRGPYPSGTHRFYPLGSQEFFVYQKNTPVSYVKFYLEPNIVYYEQLYQGNAGVYVSISTSIFGKSVQNGNTSTLIQPSGSNSFTSTNLLENLSFPGSGPVLNTKGNTSTYYLNFYEAVKESKKTKLSYGYDYLCFENQSSGYGYGPNEFVATTTDPTIATDNGVSYYYEATVDAKETGYQTTGFHLSSESLIQSFNSYYFLLGYNIPKATSSGILKVNETGLNTTSLKNTSWHFYLGDKCYSNGSSSLITIKGLPYSQFNYTVPDYGKYISNPESGFISVLESSTNKATCLNISFFQPIGSLPNYWGISDKGEQSFYLKSPAKVNYITLYLYNFTIPPGAASGQTPTNYISVTLCNLTNNAQVYTGITKVSQTGWTQIFITSASTDHAPITLGKGGYTVKVSDVNSKGEPSQAGSIGWGFSLTGGYNNYLQRVESDTMTSELNISKNSVITPYDSNSMNVCDVTNQSFIFGIGYYDLLVSHFIIPYHITKNFVIQGSINSKGITQFTISETYVLQDGIILTAGKGVTYVTVNPLPIRILSTATGEISLSSIGYNMSMQKGISSSVSGTGSTIVSMSLSSTKLVNYTKGLSYVFNGKLGQVVSIDLKKFNYTINSNYAKYWAETLFSELATSSSIGNYSSFSLFNHFNFLLNGNREKAFINSPVSLYSVNIKDVNLFVDSI
ncbi:MAG: hypothetical protein ACYCSO_06625 [Cuniculiplasma sp.]